MHDTMTYRHKRLHQLKACRDADEWASRFPTLEEAWQACDRGDWMLWYAGKMAGPPGHDSRRPLVLAACECARIALPIFEEKHQGDLRPRKAIETAEAWARGDAGVTLDDVRAAFAAASAAAFAAASAAAFAAFASAAFASAAFAAAAAATSAGIVAASAAAFAAFASAAAARPRILAECAAIVRKHYPHLPEARDGK